MKNPKGAGRKLKYREPTKRVSFRLPESKADIIKSIINRWLKKFE